MGLTRQDITRAGLRLLNEVGLNGLTYWHMTNKQELLDEMATRMYADAAPARRTACATSTCSRSALAR